ncbi:MAG: hypothetical protein K6F94_07170 [Bacteroidaceae bacterium]|nr:hypothetical protein [Bacteroidaceae bacterium]
MKRKLLFALTAILIGVGNVWAQTNIISEWDGGNNTSSPSNFGWSSAVGTKLNALNGSGVRMTNTYSGYKLEDGTSYSYVEDSEPSKMIFWVRYNNNSEAFIYTFKGLTANYYYDFSGLVGWHNNSDAPTFTISIKQGDTSLATMTKAPSAKQTLYAISSRIQAPSNTTSDTEFKIVFTCNKNGDCMEAISALSLVNVVVKDDLNTAISYANRVNTTLSDETLGTAITTAQGVSDNASATQAQVDEAKATLNTAVATALANDSRADFTFVIDNPGFESCTAITANQSTGTSVDYADNGWKVLSTSTGFSCGAVVAYGSDYTLNGKKAPASDNESASGNALGVSIGWNTTVAYQTKKLILPAGTYTYTVHVFNNNDEGDTFSSKCGFIPTEGESKLSTTTSYTYGEWGTDQVTFSLAEPTEGVFQIGGLAGNATSTTHAKVFFDNITLSYSNPLKAAQDELAALIASAKTEHAKAMVAAQKTALGTAITTAEAASKTTVEECNSARDALQTAIDNAAPSIAIYAEIKAKIIDIQSAIINDAENTAIVALNAGYNEGTYETVDAALTAFKNAVGSSFATTENTVYTGAIINPNFEADGAAVSDPFGWSFTKHGADDGTRNSAVTDMSGWYYNAYQTWWDTGIDIKQTITGLPNGQYTLTATLAGWEGCTVDLTGNDEKTFINGAGDGTGVAASVDCYVSDGTLNIKVNWGVKDGGTFFKADNFTLTYKGIKPLLNEVITQANAIGTTANVGTGAFQIPSAAASTFASAITTAQSVYENVDATAEQVQTAIDNLNAAIETYQNTTLNAPASGAQYRIKSTAADAAAWKNKYYVLKVDAGQAHGGYSTRAEVETTDAFYATAWQFTNVSGNTYKLSMTDVSGDTRYLCTNIKGYAEGNATQIRTTTDADKALVVKVIAATGTAGRWYLQNTEDNSYLGGQDAGLFSNSQNYDLAIEAAVKASVTVSANAGKYGTVIFPFTPDVSTGFDDITFYSCASVNNETKNVQLEEVTTPAANVPYLIKNDGSEDFSKPLTGWGTASATSYKPDGSLLTGVYTNAEIAAGSNNYILQTQGGTQAFYLVKNAAFEAVPYKAYLTYSSGASVKAFGFEFGGTTGVNEELRMTNEESASAVIYDLQGRRVAQPTNGLYIINGKKVLVK